MKNLILVLIGFIFTTSVFAQPDFNEFKKEKLKISNVWYLLQVGKIMKNVNLK